MGHVQFRELTLAALRISAIILGRDGIDRRHRLCIGPGLNIQLYDPQLLS
jgi:hypothetical protein